MTKKEEEKEHFSLPPSALRSPLSLLSFGELVHGNPCILTYALSMIAASSGTSLTSTHGELQFMFIDSCFESPPVVEWGYANSSGGGEDTALPFTSDAGTTDTYTVDELAACNSTDTTAVERFVAPGALHTVLLKGIDGNKAIYYRVGHATSAGKTPGGHAAGCSSWSPVVRHVGIRSSTTAATTKATTDLLYVADMGVGPARSVMSHSVV